MHSRFEFWRKRIKKTVGEQPFDWGGDFFNGGYNTFRHSSLRNDGKVNATQIETPIAIRANMDIIRKFSDAFAITVREFIKTHYSLDVKEVPLKKK